MDHGALKNIPCKVSLVNYNGEVILDTLIHDGNERVRSCAVIHGISESLLNDAPSKLSIREWILNECKNCIFVGHSVKYDLKVMGLGDVQFIDTSTLYNDRQPSKLKVMAREHLNAKIQQKTHSSVRLTTNISIIFRSLMQELRWQSSDISRMIYQTTFSTYAKKNWKTLDRKATKSALTNVSNNNRFWHAATRKAMLPLSLQI